MTCDTSDGDTDTGAIVTGVMGDAGSAGIGEEGAPGVGEVPTTGVDSTGLGCGTVGTVTSDSGSSGMGGGCSR